MSGAIRVLSERIMSRGFEPTVSRIMENVQKTVMAQPGLISVETLSDVNDHHRYVVLSKWESKDKYEMWLKSDAFKECTKKINDVLDVPGKQTRIFEDSHDDVFLL